MHQTTPMRVVFRMFLAALLLFGFVVTNCGETEVTGTNAPELEITPENTFDFPYPTIQLRERNEQVYTFLLAGPSGNWKIVGGTGVTSMSRNRGTFPFTLQVSRDTLADQFSLQLEYIGAAFTRPDGRPNRRGEVYSFGYDAAD